MRKLLCLIILCSIILPAWSQADHKLADLGLKGKVSSVIEHEYQIANDGEKEIRRNVYSFNQTGCKLEEECSDPMSKVFYSAKFKYYPSGELQEENVNNCGHSTDYIKTYDWSPGKLNINIQYPSEQPVLYSKYTLNSKGKIIKRIDYDKGGTFRVIDYDYTPAGNLQTEKQLMQGSVNMNFKYSYNGKGQIEKKIETNNAGKVMHTTTYTYDDKGNVISEVASYTDDPNILTLTYKYVYDSNGNWTEKQEYMDNNLFSLVKREIAYF